MKKERRKVITMTDNGIITVPNNVRMSIVEIADLFSIYCRTVKRYIRAIEKAGIAEGDYVMGCTADGRKVYPDYYGLGMIIALAFRIHSRNAEVFRQRVLAKVSATDSRIQTLIFSDHVFLN